MEEYLKLAKEIAEGAAEIALKYFGFDVEKTWKDDNTPLTLADTKINRLVIEMIHSKYPEHSVQGEEESSKKLNSRYIWVCDPIDGTMQYSCGLPIFTFSLALVDQSDGQPTLGIVNDPIMKNMYWAYKGAGAFRNGRKISVMNTENLQNTCLNVDASGKDIGFAAGQTIEHLLEHGAKVMKLLSFIYGGIQVANGKFSGAIFFNPYAYDVAALKIITEEAGGRVTDLDGNERRYDENGLGCVISNGTVHQEIIECIRRAN